MTKNNLPDTPRGANGLVPAEDAVNVLDTWVESLPVLEDDDLTGRTLARIMTAESPDQAFANPELEGMKGLAGQVITLHGVQGRRPSAFGEGQYYLMYDITIAETGERTTVSCGSPYVAAGAFAAVEKGWLPVPVRVTELASKTKPGQSSLWLVVLPRHPHSVGAPAGFES